MFIKSIEYSMIKLNFIIYLHHIDRITFLKTLKNEIKNNH